MADIQSGKLVLDGCKFAVRDCRETTVFIFDNDDDIDEERDVITKTFSMDVRFEKGTFGDEEVSPELIINEFATGTDSIDDMIGMEFSVKDVEEAIEREDTMYVFEHEPLMNYKLKILGKEGALLHVQISGTAITDGYSDPAQIAGFEGEFWMNIKA